MSLSNIFTSHLPTLDLHGEDRESARVAINDFIRDNQKMKNDKIVIVHGKGTGILKKTTQNVLTKSLIFAIICLEINQEISYFIKFF